MVATSTFRRCPAPQGACVMSWPPHHVPNKPFSFLIRLTTQTRPFDPAPLVHLTTGTRRWAHKEVTLSLNRDHSVYMLPKLPWLSGLVHSRSFLVAKIELRRKSSTKVKEGFEYSARWAGVHFEQILRELGIYEMLPSPEELKKNPVAGLSEVDAAALVFRNGMYTTFDHPVAAGTSLADKVPMLEWASETLAPYLEPVEPLRKGTHFILDHNKLKKDKYSTATPQQLRAAIADVIGPTLGVDILYDTRETKDQARAALATLLGIAVPEDTNRTTGKPEVITTEELTILSSVRPVGRCGGRLTVDGNIANPRERLKTAVSSRAKAIEDELGEAQAPTISLVEIKGKKSYQGKERAADPKFAIKVGLSRTGRLAQCITSGKDVAKDSDDSRSRSETLKNCWYDLLRQLGVRIQDLPVPLNGTSITTAPAYLAFWLIRQNQRNWEGITRQIPVAVLIDPTGREIKACAPNVKWMPLHRAQHEINRRHMLTDQRRTPEEVTRFFDGVLRSVARQFPSLLLLTCAQNLRWGWSALSNSTMKPDMIQFGHRPQPITRYPGLRHVRVRTPERDEVPDTYADNDKNAGHSPGYWVADNRIFLSTGEKPPAARKAVKDASKLVPRWVKGELVNARTKTPVWNSRALEITVAAIQPGDAPEDWAALTHELRWAAPHYAYSVSLPWPLKIAQQISQYVMPVELLEELEESEEEQEETDDLVG
ncbi:RNaseH domain-containing protein [Saccharopolyspora rectivirgula]|uniref:RNaseH domain-containing protein n=1 Tax=Saccharopolyspora rectivirgula TaxID=28042 RepID=UPI000412A363|nr:RNaseH domain-containing protein [Saccharopolyspora rectivirgula]